MGLDDFKSEDNDEPEPDDEIDTEGEIKEESKNVEEKTDQSGLSSFVSDDEDSHWTDELERDRVNPWMEDFSPSQWNDMTTQEKVRYVRTNYDENYRPDVKLDRDWDYRKVIEIECKCRNTFTFRSAGTCMDCGRGYSYTGSSVVMRYDPHNSTEN